MARVRFLAAAADPRPGQENIVYGPNHETDFDDTDVEYVVHLRQRGLAEVMNTDGLTPPALAALGIPQPA